MLRRLHPDQPENFAFTPANLAWAEGQITKYPDGRQASAIIPLLWRAQEQEGWLSRAAIESVADMLGMAYIRALEVASFYFMFQLQPVGSVAHIQICGTTSCMICGAEDLVAVCREKIAEKPHVVSDDGKFSWEEVECLGSCTNAPMAQIGKDYYEDLTTESLARVIDEMAAGKVPTPGPQNGRYACEPLSGLTSLTEYDSGKPAQNASVALATDIGDTIKRIDGSEVPLLTPWVGKDGKVVSRDAKDMPPPAPETPKPAVKQAAEAKATKPAPAKPAPEAAAEEAPDTLDAPRDGNADDLKLLKGVGPKLEQTLNELGFYHFDQIAAWSPEQVAWVDSRLKFKGRIERDGWIAQAADLAAGKETEFAKRTRKDGANED
ncbi:NADH-quinone oxidoreductase subunit E [Ruegeria sp. 2012CJ41-6]|uniref:NADH-quinone oxidoreductase subunit E n=1 Tax=Ruegeria spongiae TaxID=2942209 RepID=A0ABT0Q2B5_9RHOB|nr:NADH-quinone oxidoreductase subunit E [Ruegeria spongiae]MCL6283980.1 NADH-quinone oxidoreductase subunit E [Ruegeria spongiae]